ncbi:uncharacterized protein EAF02_010677 [Botrytis sinoallii]|uniref:uncharacterized protein n=1 Tax=Botrytis sinoallii TaxID=1463999 RepID=UPI0018FFE223|nr:uncharacterized protein EAF02_010677 [Botrytis sinoallii]KAF7861723.1 hypothetical protein EAF02_010677 [Botrytis sinoallii]
MSNIRMSFFNTDSITCDFVRLPMKSRARSQLVSDDVDRCENLRFDGQLRDLEEFQDLLGLIIVMEMTLSHPYGQLRWQVRVVYLSGGWGSGSRPG